MKLKIVVGVQICVEEHFILDTFSLQYSRYLMKVLKTEDGMSFVKCYRYYFFVQLNELSTDEFSVENPELLPRSGSSFEICEFQIHADPDPTYTI